MGCGETTRVAGARPIHGGGTSRVPDVGATRARAGERRSVSARRIGAALALLVATSPLGGCTAWFFVPSTELVATPADFGFAYEDVALESADGTALHAWLIEPNGATTGTVYFLHGNAENVSTHVRAALWLLEAGYRVFALDYRGYGRSAGSPDVPEVLEDVRAGGEWLFAHLGARGDDEPVHVFAQSLGASLAIRHLALHPELRARVDALVVEAAFTRYGAIARHVASRSLLLRPFGPLAERVLAGPHDPLDAIGALAPLPIMIVHSVDDSIVPHAFGAALHAAAGEPKAFLETRGPHIAAVLDPTVREAILVFLRLHERSARTRGAADDD